MSGLDQPILIAQTSYHVRHQMSVRIPEEQGFFAEEGLTTYEYDWRGMCPGPLERDGLAMIIRQQGIDLATSAGVEAALFQRANGADLYIVGAWRYMPRFRLYAAPEVKTLGDLRGRRIGLREPGGINQLFLALSLRQAGVDAATEIEWVYEPTFAYGTDHAHVDALRSGAVAAAPSHAPFAEELEAAGCHRVLDSRDAYPEGRPGKVLVAPRRTIEERGEELRAFLRGVIRGFWFVRDPANYDYICDLERRLRQRTHNDDERQFAAIPSADGLEELGRPVYGSFPPEALDRVIREMRTVGQLERDLDVPDVLRDEAARQAFSELSAREALRPAREKAVAAAAKHGQ
jgi:ABC-type nitrate/sulfonate/bicarbonate transport system substrate-binding protein